MGLLPMGIAPSGSRGVRREAAVKIKPEEQN